MGGFAHAVTGDFGDYQPTASDVIACSGFKSGTTWLLQIAVQIVYRGEAEFNNIHSVVAWPDAPGVGEFIIPLTDDSPLRRSPTGLRVIKTHHAQNKVPYSADARYIAVVRDPKDVIVSGYHFVQSLLYGPLMPSVEHWVDLNLSGDLPPASWAEHLASYWRVRNRPNVLFMTYENMKKDTRATVLRVAQFMGVNLTEVELERVAHRTSFAYMKQFQSKFEPGRVVPWGREGCMVRKGQSGGSSELLMLATQVRIDEHCRAELKRMACDFPYDKEFGGG